MNWIFFWAFIGAFMGVFLPSLGIILIYRITEKQVADNKKKALEDLVIARKEAYKKVNDTLHEAILNGQIKTYNPKQGLTPFDDDNGRDPDDDGGFN